MRPGAYGCASSRPSEHTRKAMDAEADDNEPRGCLFALSQPPLMLFLTVIGSLLAFGGLYDLWPF